MNHLPARQRAFTLIELLVVIAIIAILAAATLPMIPAVHDQARITTCEARLAQIGIALRLYVDDHREYPATLQALYDGRYLEQEGVLRCDKTSRPYFYQRPSLTAPRTTLLAACCDPKLPLGKRPHRNHTVAVQLSLGGETKLLRQ